MVYTQHHKAATPHDIHSFWCRSSTRTSNGSLQIHDFDGNAWELDRVIVLGTPKLEHDRHDDGWQRAPKRPPNDKTHTRVRPLAWNTRNEPNAIGSIV